eukprot:190722-Hanusia_phi.AAC.2
MGIRILQDGNETVKEEAGLRQIMKDIREQLEKSTQVVNQSAAWNADRLEVEKVETYPEHKTYDLQSLRSRFVSDLDNEAHFDKSS